MKLNLSGFWYRKSFIDGIPYSIPHITIHCFATTQKFPPHCFPKQFYLHRKRRSDICRESLYYFFIYRNEPAKNNMLKHSTHLTSFFIFCGSLFKWGAFRIIVVGNGGRFRHRQRQTKKNDSAEEKKFCMLYGKASKSRHVKL